MKPLPPSDVLATLVTNVTKTMLGITFAPVPQMTPPAELRWKTAVLPIPGARAITVGLSSDQPGCKALSAAMFQCPAADVDPSMMDDSLRELVNITAGLVKGTLGLDQALGLPRVLSSVDHIQFGPPQGQAVVLSAQGLGLVLWVCEGIQTFN